MNSLLDTDVKVKKVNFEIYIADRKATRCHPGNIQFQCFHLIKQSCDINPIL